MYNPNVYTPQLQMQPPVTQATQFNAARQEVIRVNGRNGAEAYQLPPNSSILLLDETAPRVWLKTTDGASYPTVKGYKIIPEEDEQIQVASSDNQYADLERRIEKLEKSINAKSNNKPNKQNKSDDQ